MELTESLSLFGFDDGEQRAFLELRKHTNLTALKLSELTQIKRTTMYRILERLVSRGLVTQDSDDKTTFYAAAKAHRFEDLVKAEESRLDRLREAVDYLKADEMKSLELDQARILVNPEQVAKLTNEMKQVECRIIDPDILKIETELILYPDKIFIRDSKESEVTSTLTRQLCELAWTLGEPL